MTDLTINPAAAISGILLIISFISFVFVYNKQIKNRVDKSDLSDLRSYVDQQDRSIHHRVDEVNDRVDRHEDTVNRKLDLILKHIMKKS